ncbi:hypothetical protein MLD38_027082 [Melastoma candidum]|uniref:Uncharacterized protein n=1 Tax=Melastoma candidum TaxID=119954 RepID=A0ACB9P6S6_9MYRT|nr:hypothetical protein MLD38_027082 [Melastoma candidum]
MGRSSTQEDSTTESLLRTVGSQHGDDNKKHHRDDNRLDEDLLEWVIDINKNLEEGHTYDLGKSWTIYRVPTNMLEAHRTAFVPKIISIGPFHYGDERYKVMEEHKMRFLIRMLGGKFEGNKNGDTKAGVGESHHHGIWGLGDHHKHSTLLNDLSLAMKNLEGRTRESYSESIKLSSKDFIRMMIVDGCFVVGLLRLYHKSREERVDDPIFTTPWMLRTLQRDLIMLENQLPYFVLEELFNLTSTDNQETPLKHLIVMFFDPLFPREDPISKLNTEIEDYHMLNIFRSTFLITARKKFSLMESTHHHENSSSSGVEERQLSHSATELEETGIEFRRHEGVDMLDIVYHNGALKIAPLTIDDNAVLLFLNFLAYEQCDKLSRPFFTNFFVFLDSLVNDVGDIEILHKYGILNHHLGSDEDVVTLVGQLCRQMVYDPDQFYLAPEAKKINHRCTVYYQSEWRHWWRNLISTYFSSPWAFLSLAAAILLLVLTFLSTFYVIYAYYQPTA